MATGTQRSATSPAPLVPNFPHIFIIVVENKEFGTVIGSDKGMPNFNAWVTEYTLLAKYYAIRHPSLPNYLALIGGDTFGVTTDCNDCYQNAPILPDQIEASGRTWKGYFEDMPEACFVGDTNTSTYMQKHDPFMYFDSIRLNADRCKRSVVPLTQLTADMAANALPDFALIVPNMCNDAHDCGLDVADKWLADWVPPLMDSQAYADGGLIVLTWDEGQDDRTCCGLTTGGGHVATVLISRWVKLGFQDDTSYTTYSLLKTIEEAWGLPYLGHAADESNVLIVKPWNH
jgi:acid phosphatase